MLCMHKKIKYKEDDFYCSKCGQELYYVCHHCFNIIENKHNKLCDECQSKKELQQQKAKDNAQKVIDGAKAVAPVVLSLAKNPKVQEKVKPVLKKVIKHK